MLAASAGHGKLVQLLLEKGVHVDAADNQSKTPLMLAADTGRASTVRLLLRSGADPTASRYEPRKHRDGAAEISYREIWKLSYENGALVDAKDWYSDESSN